MKTTSTDPTEYSKNSLGMPTPYLSGDWATQVIDAADRISLALGIDDATLPELLIKAADVIDEIFANDSFATNETSETKAKP